MALGIAVNISSGSNVLLLIWRQAITWFNAESLSFVTSATYSSEISKFQPKYTHLFQRKAFKKSFAQALMSIIRIVVFAFIAGIFVMHKDIQRI